MEVVLWWCNCDFRFRYFERHDKYSPYFQESGQPPTMCVRAWKELSLVMACHSGSCALGGFLVALTDFFKIFLILYDQLKGAQISSVGSSHSGAVSAADGCCSRCLGWYQP